MSEIKDQENIPLQKIFQHSSYIDIQFKAQ